MDGGLSFILFRISLPENQKCAASSSSFCQPAVFVIALVLVLVLFIVSVLVFGVGTGLYLGFAPNFVFGPCDNES